MLGSEALMMAGSDPNGASNAAALNHWFSCSARDRLPLKRGLPIRFGRHVIALQAKEVMVRGTPDWAFQFWVNFHPPSTALAARLVDRKGFPLPKGNS